MRRPPLDNAFATSPRKTAAPGRWSLAGDRTAEPSTGWDERTVPPSETTNRRKTGSISNLAPDNPLRTGTVRGAGRAILDAPAFWAFWCAPKRTVDLPDGYD